MFEIEEGRMLQVKEVAETMIQYQNAKNGRGQK